MRTSRLVTIVALSIGVVAAGFALRLYREGGLPQQVLVRALQKTFVETDMRYDGTLEISGPAGDPLVTKIRGTTQRSPLLEESRVTMMIPAAFTTAGFFDAGALQLDLRRSSSTTHLQLRAVPPVSFSTALIRDTWIALPAFAPPSPDSIDSLFYYQATLPVQDEGRTQHHYKLRAGSGLELLTTSLLQSISTFSGSFTATSTREQVVAYTQKISRAVQPATKTLTGSITIGVDGLVQELVLEGPISLSDGSKASLNIALTLTPGGLAAPSPEPEKAKSLALIADLIEQELRRPSANTVLNDITGWVSKLSPRVQADLAVVEGLLVARYTGAEQRSTASTYDRCSNYILGQATQLITKEQLELRASYPAAETAINDSSAQTIAAGILREYIMPNVIAKIGLEALVQSERQSGALSTVSSRDACKNLPVPARYR